MADLSLCRTENCPLEKNCRRKQTSDDPWQSWIAPAPSEDCVEFLPKKETRE